MVYLTLKWSVYRMAGPLRKDLPTHLTSQYICFTNDWHMQKIHEKFTELPTIVNNAWKK